MAKNGKRLKQTYGIGEWFGVRIEKTDETKRRIYAEDAANARPSLACPFLTSFEGAEVICHKRGGVCSISQYTEKADGTFESGKALTATCPSRFYQNRIVFKEIGKLLLGTDDVSMASEVDFLTSTVTGKAAGSIDWVLFANGDRAKWCAIEFQAVYFQGAKMGPVFKAYAEPGVSSIVFPTGTRRPDFRSSGPKRLMPQLMIKVPTLRRWGKKCAVVVDKEFFDAMGDFKTVPHVSNCDIVWVVVSYQDGKLKITEDTFKYSTLESSMEGLTGGVPVSLPAFELELKKKSLISFKKSETCDNDGDADT